MWSRTQGSDRTIRKDAAQEESCPQKPTRIAGVFLSTSNQQRDYVYKSKVFPYLSQFSSKFKHLSSDENEGFD